MSRRTERIESILHRAIQQVLARGLNDPRMRGLITVTGIDVSPDLKNAKILISVLPEEHEALTMHGLRSAAKHIRHQVSNLVRMRTMPAFEFEVDRALKRQSEVLRAIALANTENESTDDQPETPSP